MNNKKIINSIFVELVEFFNSSGNTEFKSSYIYTDYQNFEKWKFRIQNSNNQNNILLSVVVRESEPHFFVLESSDNEEVHTDLIKLKKEALTLLKELIFLI